MDERDYRNEEQMDVSPEEVDSDVGMQPLPGDDWGDRGGYQQDGTEDSDNTGMVVDDYSMDEAPRGHKNFLKRIGIVILRDSLIAGVFVVMIIILLQLMMSGYIGSFLSGPAISEYHEYLEDKYGKDEGFSFTGRNGENGCPVFNAGFCERLFVSKKTGKEFLVRYDAHGSAKFSDEYDE